MKSLFRTTRMTLSLLMAGAAAATPALAQSANVVPVPLPTIGAVPESTDAQQTHDAHAIEQLMYIVELSRLATGGVEQIVVSVRSMTSLLGAIRDTANAQLNAITGTKTLPMENDANAVAARAGGPGLKEMADGAMNGAPVGPQGVLTALDLFRTDYHLDPAFALSTSQTFSKVIVAHASAQGAIAASTGEDSYKRANASMERIGRYLAALEASPDLKTSIDINTRVMLEMTQQTNEMLRTQAAIASIAGTYFMALGAETGQDDHFFDFSHFNR